MDSKLARRMAYKKKLEEEYRQFQERCQYDKRSSWGGYETRLCGTEQWSYQEISLRRRTGVSNEDDELERRRQIEADRLEEEKKTKEEEYQREREKWRKKKEECSKRASKFADLKRRRVEERKKQEEAKKILETEDMWEELDQIIRENEAALADLKQYQVTVESLVKEQKARQERKKENKLNTHCQTDSAGSSTRSSDDPPDSAEDEDLESIYSRIRELEQSIVTLGMTF